MIDISPIRGLYRFRYSKANSDEFINKSHVLGGFHVEQLEMHAIAKGNVQGVFFRATTKSYADQLQLKGTVRNLPDSNVEIIAQGTKSQLEALLDQLQSDAGMGSVSSFETQFYPPKANFTSFQIIY